VTCDVLVLIPCGKVKATEPRPARDLYLGSSFRLARTAAEADGRRWAILSALHGIVDPDKVLVPYDRTLDTRAHRDALVRRLQMQPNPGPVEAWVPSRYLAALRAARITVVAAPLDGLTMGWRSHWFKDHAAAAAERSAL